MLIRPRGMNRKALIKIISVHLLVTGETNSDTLAKEKTTCVYVCWLNFLKAGIPSKVKFLIELC